MDHVEDAGGASVSLLGEGTASVLAGEAGVADLFHLLQRWPAADHVMVGNATQGLKADVAESGVPAPRRLLAPRGQAHPRE